LPLAVADGASGFAVGGIDCLLLASGHQRADVGTWFLATSAVPVSLLVISVVVVSAWSCVFVPRSERSLVTLVVRPVMVFTNNFLPSMLTACLRGLPCYHTQADSYTNTRPMMMYQVDSSCPSYESWQFSIGLLGATLILAI